MGFSNGAALSWWISWRLGTAGAVRWGSWVLLHMTRPCDSLELPHSMVVSRQQSKSTKMEAARPFRAFTQEAKQQHFHHIRSVKANHRSFQIQGEGKRMLALDERSGEVSLQRESRMGKAVAAIFGNSLPRLPSVKNCHEYELAPLN